MKRPSFLLLLLTFAGFSFAVSCKHDSADPAPSPVNNGGDSTGGNPGTGTGTGSGGGTTNPPDTGLCFERDILPIFVSNCAKSGCHDAASRQDGYVFTSYQTITSKKFRAGDPEHTELYEKITEDKPSKRMPPPQDLPLTQQQVGLIYRWITSGAPNSTGCAGGCDSTRFTYSGVVQPLITQQCRGCHNSATSSGGVNLDNYAGVKAVAADGRLQGVINHSPGYPPMPQGGQKLSSCQIMQVEKWLASGASNN